MYTLHMSWSFRTVALSAVLVWVLAPQLACFMPSQAAMPSEMDCCKGMAADCHRANMSQSCCQTWVRTDLGISTKVVRNPMPPIDSAGDWADPLAGLPGGDFSELSTHNSHAPPPETVVSSSVLRI
jgi:hypothetical protein